MSSGALFVGSCKHFGVILKVLGSPWVVPATSCLVPSNWHHLKVAFGRSVRFRNGFGISVFSVCDGEFEGRSPQEMQGGYASPQQDQLSHVGIGSVRFGICLGSVGFFH